MKATTGIGLAVIWLATAVSAQPLRVAVIDFEDQTGMRSDARMGGAIEPGAMAEKGVYLLGKNLANQEGFVLIDRRDFINQMEQLRPMDGARPTPTRPSFLHAAQALRADAVLRGNLVSLSTGKQMINQGGYQTEFQTLSLRVSLEALDAVDGAVIAVTDGVARKNVRQTQAVQTVMSEDEILELMEQAMSDAVRPMRKALEERVASQRARPTIKLSISTSADPALVEIDGILVGTTPLVDHEIYKGDHVLTIGKPGYRDITKRILFESDTRIEAPMLRTELTADEMKDVLEKMRLHVFVGEPGLIIHTINE